MKQKKWGGVNPIRETSGTKYATEQVNIRRQPDKNSEKLGSLNFADRLEVTGVTGDGKWYQFEFDGREGFVSAFYLSDSRPKQEESNTGSPEEQPEGNAGSESNTDQEDENNPEEDGNPDDPANQENDANPTEAEYEDPDPETEPAPVQSFAGQLSVSENLDQLIIVEAETNNSQAVTVTMHERQNGVWVEILRTEGYVGYNGIAKGEEGDGRTPTGVYGLSVAFGTKPDPGSIISYTQVDEHYWWIGDHESQYFNQLCRYDVPDRDWELDPVESEHLVEYNGYEYCLFIEYNTGGAVGKGSCIFLHCIGKNPYTLGCVAVPEDDMIFLLQHIQRGFRILIDTTNNLSRY